MDDLDYDTMTDEELEERLRLARAVGNAPDQMERTQAVVAYINNTRGYGESGEDLKFAAFLALFHPDRFAAMSSQEIRQLRR